MANDQQVTVETLKQFLEAFIDVGIRLSKAVAGLAIYLANGSLECGKCITQILELRVEILLAFGLLLEFIDGRKVDRP